MSSQGLSCATAQLGPDSDASPVKPLENLVQLQPAATAHSEPVATERKGLPDEITLLQSDLTTHSASTSPTFTLSARDVDVKTVLFALSNEIPQNLVIDPSIDQRVTVDLKDVPLEQALENILSPLRIRYELDESTLRVTPEKLETRIFHLNYIMSRRVGNSNLSSSSGGGRSGDTSAQSGASSGNSGSGRSTSSIESQEVADVWTEIIESLGQIVSASARSPSSSGVAPDADLGSADIGSATGDSLSGSSSASSSSSSSSSASSAVAGDPERPYFTVNRQAGMVIVKDYPDILMKVAEVLEMVEGSVHRQVFIQAKIIEVTLNDEYKLGIDWSQVSPITLASSDTGAGTILGGLENATITGAANFTYGIANANFSVVVDALSKQGNVNVLSNPKIATLNNQRAVIKVGTEDIFFVPETTPATTTTAATTTFTPEAVTIGIVMDVVPQINSNGNIMMSINTSITEKNGERTSPDGINIVPILDVRESNNVVLSGNGQTIVIGGLMKTRKEDKDNSVPLLGDLPILGRLFQHVERTVEKTELVIMLTPQIMAGQEIDERKAREMASLGNMGFAYPNESPWGNPVQR